MKTYMTPSIASKGTVAESTRAVIVGSKDPKSPMFLEKEGLGSVGFQL